MKVVQWIFWAAAVAVFYAYAGYPLWLFLRRQWRACQVVWAPVTPFVSIIMAVRNEAALLPRKLENLAALDYPPERMEIIVVSDGSTDRTNEILIRFSRVRSILLGKSRGKASALNHAIALAQGEIVLFVDVRQRIGPSALKFLAGNFADPDVGCVSGELTLTDDVASGKARAVGLYWRIEKLVRKLESETGSVIGATGALYAVRRELLPQVPSGTLCDDLYIPLQVVRQRKRVVFESRAVAFDAIFSDWKREFRRKVRTLAGNYQLLQLSPWLVTSENPLRFELFSHKFLRLLVPFLLIVMLVASLVLHGWFYRSVFVLQLCFYSLGLLAVLRPKRKLPRLASLSFTFTLLNAAAVVGLIKFMTGSKDVWAARPL